MQIPKIRTFISPQQSRTTMTKHNEFTKLFQCIGKNQMISLSDLGDRIFYTGRKDNLPKNLYDRLHEVEVSQITAIGFEMTIEAIIRIRLSCYASYTRYGNSDTLSIQKV